VFIYTQTSFSLSLFSSMFFMYKTKKTVAVGVYADYYNHDSVGGVEKAKKNIFCHTVTEG